MIGWNRIESILDETCKRRILIRSLLGGSVTKFRLDHNPWDPEQSKQKGVPESIPNTALELQIQPRVSDSTRDWAPEHSFGMIRNIFIWTVRVPDGCASENNFSFFFSLSLLDSTNDSSSSKVRKQFYRPRHARPDSCNPKGVMHHSGWSAVQTNKRKKRELLRFATGSPSNSPAIPCTQHDDVQRCGRLCVWPYV